MAKNPAPHAPADKVELYEKLLATIPGVERKGAADPYTSVNGNMFSQLLPSGRVSIGLPALLAKTREAAWYFRASTSTLHH